MTAFDENAAARLSRRHALEIWGKLILMAISGEPHCREHRISETTCLLVYQAWPKRNAALMRHLQDLAPVPPAVWLPLWLGVAAAPGPDPEQEASRSTI
jgi:hypothetical protein